MKKFFITLLVCFLFNSVCFSESYYFNACDLSEKYLGNYLIDLDKNSVQVSFVEIKGDSFQEKKYKIEKITDNQIITEKKENVKQKGLYLQ